MESPTERVEGFGEEVMVVAAWVCCHSEHSAESHWVSAGEAGNGMQGVKEGTEAEGMRYMKEMWLMFIPQEEKDKQTPRSTFTQAQVLCKYITYIQTITAVHP